MPTFPRQSPIGRSLARDEGGLSRRRSDARTECLGRRQGDFRMNGVLFSGTRVGGPELGNCGGHAVARKLPRRFFPGRGFPRRGPTRTRTSSANSAHEPARLPLALPPVSPRWQAGLPQGSESGHHRDWRRIPSEPPPAGNACPGLGRRGGVAGRPRAARHSS
jgi:hypothetical protein